MNQEIKELLLARHHKEKGYDANKLIDLLVEELEQVEGISKDYQNCLEEKEDLEIDRETLERVRRLVEDFDTQWGDFLQSECAAAGLDFDDIKREIGV